MKEVLIKIGVGVGVTVGVHILSEGIIKCIDMITDPENQVKVINGINNLKTKLQNKKWSKSKET